MDNDQTIHTIKTLTSNNSNQSRKPTCNLCSKLSAKSNHNLCCNRSKWPRWSASLIFVSYFQFRTNQRKANVLSNQSQRMPHFCLDCLQLPQANILLKGTPSRLQPFLFSHSSDCLWVSAKLKWQWLTPMVQRALNKQAFFSLGSLPLLIHSQHGSWLPPQWMRWDATREKTQIEAIVFQPNFSVFHPFCHIIFIRTETISPTYTQMQGITQGVTPRRQGYWRPH